MKLKFLVAITRRSGRARIWRMMRGYRYLKASRQLGKLPALREALTSFRLMEQGEFSSRIFGAGLERAELVARQYLLVRFGAAELNAAILRAIGANRKVVHPLPPTWRKALRDHGFEVAGFRSAIWWWSWIIAYFCYGIISSLRTIVAGVWGVLRRERCPPERSVYFDSLVLSNLPKGEGRGRSYDIFSWYATWDGRIKDARLYLHGIPETPSLDLGDNTLRFIRSPIPTLDQSRQVWEFVVWAVAAACEALAGLVRGRWWNALMLNEGVKAAAIRLQDPAGLSTEYLFHNSNWIYRPLWTYEAERRGARITFYFYSTNSESFKTAGGYPRMPFGWQAMNWPRYLVWDEWQADFVRRAVGNPIEICVVGSIWFQSSQVEPPPLPTRAVAVFDVQPMRDSFYQKLGMDVEYYVPSVAEAFLCDIWEILSERGWSMALKRKREIGRIAHPKYYRTLEKLERLPNFVAVDPSVSASTLIDACDIVISMPFTSTALIAREAGKPSAYYDPTGICQKDDRAAHGIEVICGKADLAAWVERVSFGRPSSESAAPLLQSSVPAG